MDLRTTPQWQFGSSTERLIASFLQQRGWWVIPSYDYSGQGNDKAPKLQGADGGLVIPDLDVARAGERRWVEVKAKSHAVLHRRTNTLKHGIPLRHFHDYLRLQHITGCEVWLVVYEQDTGDVLMARLNALAGEKQEYAGGKMSRGGMVFFPRSDFRIVGNLSGSTRGQL